MFGLKTRLSFMSRSANLAPLESRLLHREGLVQTGEALLELLLP